MKLHLPKNLLVALLATIVGVTQSAWGLEPLKSSGWHETNRNNKNPNGDDLGTITIDATNGQAVLGDGWNQNRATYVLTEALGATETEDMNFSITISNLTGTGGLFGIAFVGASQTIALGDLDYNGATLQYGISDDTTSDFWITSGNDWENYTGGKTTSTTINNIGTATGTSYKLDGNVSWVSESNAYVLTLRYNDSTEPVVTVGLENPADVERIVLYTDGLGATFSGLTLSGASVSFSELIWGGTASSNTWSASSTPWGGTETSSSRSDITFDTIGTSGVSGTVVVEGAVKAAKIVVNDNYSFHVDKDAESSIGASLISVADGKELNKTGDGSLSITSSVEGNLKVSGGVLGVTGTIKGDVVVSGGDLNVSGAGAIAGSSLQISDGTVTAELNAQSNLSIISSGTSVSILTGGKLHLKGHDMLGWGATSPSEILLKSSSETALAELQFEDSGATTLKTAINMQGNSKVSGTSINTFGTTFKATGDNNEISVGTILVRDNALSITVDDTVVDGQEVEGKLTISGILKDYTGQSNGITKKGTGELILTGVNTYSGETNIEAGTLTVSGSGTLGTGAVIVGSEGALKIAGSSESTNGANLVAASGAGDIIVSGNTKLISGEGNQVTSATGKLTINSGATLTVGTGDLHLETGDAMNQGASIDSFTRVVLDNGTLRIENPGATVQNLEVTSAKGYIHVEDVQNDKDSSGAYTDALFLTGTTTLNGELKYTNTWNSQVNIEKLSGTGNLVIDGTGRKTSESSTFIIAGAENYTGEVQMINGASNMTLNVADDLGINVRYRTRSGQADLSQIGSGNTIHLVAFAGAIKNGTIEADVVIDNGYGTDGAFYAGAELLSADAGDKITYTGDISGSGNYIVGTGDASTTTEFSGDISDWNKGALRISKGSQNVVYTGNATSINHEIQADGGAEVNVSMKHDAAATVAGSIGAGGGTTKLSVSNSHGDGTTFTNSATIAEATIEEGTKVTFSHASVKVDDILVKAAAQLSFSAVESLSVATLEVQSGATVTVGTLENEKTLTVTSHATFSGGQVNANLAFADGAEVTLNQALSMGSSLSLGNNLTLSGEQYTAITSMTSDSGPVKLFTGVDTLTLGGDSYTAGSSTLDSSSGKDLSDYFSNVDSGKYYLGYNAAGDVYAGLIVPEPATATLSLLALAGLMARRRRAK